MTDSETHRIQSLDADTIQRIAAGEVVERPASVVKELLENSLDAGASRIDVAVEHGGKDGIRISDDGHGIPQSELPHAVDEHATSKIQDIEDLDGGIASLGFRGEALSTIAAVSQLTIRSRPQGGAAGAELIVEGGDRRKIQPAGCPEGTTVEIERLFFNTPARKKFLKRDSTEFDHINTVVSQYALANPEVAISLSHNGRELFATEGGGSLRSTVLSVYGREVAESMIELSELDTADTAVDAVSGLISHPETTRSTREYLATFVNGRYVTDSALRRAVLDGYGGQLAADRYPFAVVFLQVPPKSVDVNVHPRKTEVRFDNDQQVMTTLSNAIERTLLESGLIRSGAPRGRSAPTETKVVPDGAAEREADKTQPTDSTPESPASTTSSDESRETTSGDERPTNSQSTTNSSGDDHPTDQTVAEPLDPDDEASWTVDGLSGTSVETTTPESSSESADRSGPADPTRSTATPSESTSPQATETDAKTPSEPTRPVESAASTESTTVAESETPTAERPSPASTAETPSTDNSQSASEQDDEKTTITMGDAKPIDPSRFDDGLTAESTTQQTLTGGETTDRRTYDQLPALRVLGQLHETYLVAATDEGLVLVDQHAADERVNYERLQHAVGDSPTSQRLADPVELELTAREAALFVDHSDALAAVGFAAEQRDNRTIEVRAVPAVFSTTLEAELLREALLRFVESTDGGAETIAETVDELLADLACYPSITGNTSLTEGSVVELLSALDDCENPYACPHGRPVIIELSRQEIEDRFERDYPGHSGRRDE